MIRSKKCGCWHPVFYINISRILNLSAGRMSSFNYTNLGLVFQRPLDKLDKLGSLATRVTARSNPFCCFDFKLLSKHYKYLWNREAIKLAVCIWINDFSFFSLSDRGSAACFMAFGFELSRVDGEKLIRFYANSYNILDLDCIWWKCQFRFNANVRQLANLQLCCWR